MSKKQLHIAAAIIWGIPGIPSAFIASFYSGLGPMLLMGSARFICMKKRIGNKN